MNVTIVHDSQAGNGEKLSLAMAKAFEIDGNVVTVGHVTSIDAATVASTPPNLLVVGAAIRAFRTSPATKTWLAKLGRRLHDEGKLIPCAAVFVTHALPVKGANGWGRRFLKHVGRIKGIGRLYPEWLSGRVLGANGPLEDGAEQAFEAHAATLAYWASGDDTLSTS